MSKNMYIDFHVIQTVPPSCVNRDDTGSPKTAFYGGTMRARVSSQSWKRAMRLMFKDLFSSEQLGYRTRHTVQLVSEELQKQNPDMDQERAEKLAGKILELAGAKAGSDKKDVLFFISTKQIQAVAQTAMAYDEAGRSATSSEKKNLDKQFKILAEQALMENPSIDVLLFGRMAASNPVLNYDAAAQVAHSISTHTISNEYDYFTAVDDCSDDDNAGAGHLGTVEFNSSTLYRYATVNVRELSENLSEEELKKTVRGFAEAFIRSMPTGKQNTFANRTLPSLIYVTARDDQPISLSGAFEKPIRAGADGYAEKSEEALFDHAKSIYENYGLNPSAEWVVSKSRYDCGDKVNFKELLDCLEQAVAEYVSSEGV